ncbi:MAG: nitric oxide reductase activation protein NorD [Clostridia bacterium]|nr:nitric oxide reductase activation protein NorD [Clostridia bacterium]
MRTSHLSLQRRIENERLKLTDEEVFASGPYSAYLTDMAEAATKRYRRRSRVRCTWNPDENAAVAFTDNRIISVNAANFLTQSFPTRQLRSDSLVGLNGHEIGHILFTDFNMLHLYMNTLRSGRMYPAEPSDLTTREAIHLAEIKEIFRDKPEVEMAVVAKAASTLTNILEDVYIEVRMCDAYPGVYRSGILLNNLRLPELTPSVTDQVKRGDHEYAIVVNLLIQYCKSGDINNLHGYAGPYLNALYDCIPLIDESVFDDDGRARYIAANAMLVKLWPYVKSMIEKTKKDLADGKLTLDELLGRLKEELDKQIVGGSGEHEGSGIPVPFKGKFKHDPAKNGEVKEEIQQVVDFETGRLELEKTDSIDEGDGGGIEYNSDYTGTGYESSAEDIARVLNQAAEDKTYRLLDEELTDELQEEAGRIRYGNAHRGIHVTVNRMSVVDQQLISAYQKIAPALLLLSKRMQKQVLQALKDSREGGKLNGLLMGKRLSARSLVRDDGRYFYNNRLPDDAPKLAVGLLVDESGSMHCCDRVTNARAAALVIHDFCNALGIPVMVYGHSEWNDVELYAYAEFDSMDGKDKYRLMDISARGGNRDGAALRFVAERLMKRDEQIRLLILVSDGQPAADNYYGTEAEADLRGIKREYQNKGITMFAAAIGDDKPNIERIYGDGFLDVTDITKLPANLTNLVSRYIKM